MNNYMLCHAFFSFILRSLPKALPVVVAFSVFIVVLFLLGALCVILILLPTSLLSQISPRQSCKRNCRTQKRTFRIFFCTFVAHTNTMPKARKAGKALLPQCDIQTRFMHSDTPNHQRPFIHLPRTSLATLFGSILLPLSAAAMQPCDICPMRDSVGLCLPQEDSVAARAEVSMVDSATQDAPCVSLPAACGEAPASPALPGDSLARPRKEAFRRLIANTRPYRITCVGLPLVAGGLVAMKGDKNFRQLRTDYFPRYKHTADDYLQYSPAVVMLGLKAAGVKSRSSWGRMLVSDAFSAGLMAIMANGLKEGLHVRRPDGSNTRSFPSGHTATAFMAATMLTKEYGYKSKWVGFGSYAVASSVGLMRMANNRHWLSDVMVGAGIGVISTELGYFFSDLIFRQKGLNRPAIEQDEYHRWDKPSFLGLRLGGYIPLMDYHLANGKELEASAGCAGGLEGAYFFNHWIGVGGQFMVSNYRILIKDNPSRTARALAFMAGPYFSWPLTSRCALGSKLTMGYAGLYSISLPDQQIPHRHGVDFGTGLSCTYKLRQNYVVGLHLDYHLLPPSTSYTSQVQNLLWAGTSFNINF